MISLQDPKEEFKMWDPKRERERKWNMIKVKPSLKERSQLTQTLASLALEANEICRLILESNGEISAELEKRFDFNAAALMGKVDSYVFIEEQLEMNASVWKQRVDACKAIHDRFVRSQEKLRDRVKFVMNELGKRELKGNHYRYLLSELKPKLVISEPDKLPSECKMVVTEVVPDKEKIKSLLQDGIDIPGATLEPVCSLRTYENAED